MKNRDIAKLFFEIADILDMQGVAWKPNAYRAAARALETCSNPIEELYDRGGLNALKELPRIGEHLARKIEEYLKTGRIKEYDTLIKKIPAGAHDMLHVPGLGPQKVMRLYKELHIKGISELEKAARAGKLQKLAGFGPKSEQDILRGLTLHKTAGERKLLGLALPIAREITERLLRLPSVTHAEPAGSLRRMKETVGDIDILVISKKPEQVMNYFTTMPEVQNVLSKGPTKSTVILKDGLQADVRVLPSPSFGAALQYFTGSKEHNIQLRNLAIKKGYKLNEYGLNRKEKYVCGKTEQDIYKKLGLTWIPPELREATHEIESARTRKLPCLIELRDMHGDLHMHSTFTDGVHTIEAMARASQQRGYSYIAMTDHSKSVRIAHGMDEKKLGQYLKEIDKIQKKFDIRILKGAEVDILPDGSLDFDNNTLKKLDIVLAAIHSRFKSTKQEMTQRILKALDNPHVNVLVHPTGRLINQREPYQVDIEKVMTRAKERGIALEIDSYPTRLDLKDAHVHMANELGCALTIDTDSHAVDHLRYMELGVATARRGWTTPQTVINTWKLPKLEKFLLR